MKLSSNTVDSGQGLETLMKTLYTRHRAGLPELDNNVFIVNFLPTANDKGLK